MNNPLAIIFTTPFEKGYAVGQAMAIPLVIIIIVIIYFKRKRDRKNN